MLLNEYSNAHMMMSVWSLALILTLYAAFSGAILLLIARRGKRVDVHPVCRKCGYDLSGLDQLPERCSECGRGLQGRQAIRIGNRRHLRGTAIIGLMLLISGLIASGIVFHHNTNEVDWVKVEPVWLLLMEARGTLGDDARGLALDELLQRTSTFHKKKLNAQQLSDLADVVLDLQQMQDPLWTRSWIQFIFDARRNGRLSDAQFRLYLQTGLEQSFGSIKTRPKVREGQPIPFRTFFNGSWGGLSRYLGVRMTLESATLDGKQLTLDSEEKETIAFTTSYAPRFDKAASGESSVGTHTLEIRYNVEADLLDPHARARWNDITFVNDTPLFQGTIVRSATIEIVSLDTKTLEPVDSREIRAQIVAGMMGNIMGTVIVVETGEVLHEGKPLEVSLSLHNPPVAVDADIFLIHPDGREELKGTLATSASSSAGTRIEIPLQDGEMPESFDLLLRGRTDRSEGTVDMIGPIWSGEILLERLKFEVGRLLIQWKHRP